MRQTDSIHTDILLDETPSIPRKVLRRGISTAVVAPPPPAGNTYEDIILNDSPVVYWRLGEASGTVAVDQTANRLDGTYTNTPTLGQTGAVSGDSDTSVLLSSVASEYITTANNAALNFTGDFSLEILAKPTSIRDAATYQATVQADNPVVYWRMAEATGTTVADTGPNNLQGTYTNTPTLGATGALSNDANTAVTFTRTSSEYASVASNAVLNITGDITVECWAKPTNLGSVWGCVLAKCQTPDSSANRQYNIFISNSNQWYGSIYAGGTEYPVTGATTAPSAGRFDHLVLRRSGNTVELFVNNVSQGTASPAPSAATQTGDGGFSVGRLGSVAGAYFNGTVDEVAVYNSALSDARITAHYNKGIQTLWPEFQCVVGKADGIPAANRQYDIYLNSDYKWQGDCYIGTTAYSVTSTTTASADRWDHLVLRRTGADLELLVNATPEASLVGVVSGELNTTTGDLAVGRLCAALPRQFDGSVDEFAAYNSALSTSSIRTHLGLGQNEQVPSVYSTAVNNDNPAVYWRLGEATGSSTAYDYTSNGLNATYTNTPTLAVTGALYNDSNTGITLNGTNEYITIGSDDLLNFTGDFTVELWAKPSTLDSSYRVALGKCSATEFANRQYLIDINNSNYWRGAVYIGSTQYTVRATSLALDTNTWYHVVMTRNASTGELKLYVNNTLQATTSGVIGSINTSAGNLSIGRNGGLDAEYFAGSVDEVAIYNTLLTEERIGVHYTLGNVQETTPPDPPTPPPAVVGVWTQLGPGASDVVWGARCGPDGTYWTTYDIGGIYRTSDQGTTWTCCNNGITNYYGYDFAFHPTDYNQVWFAGRGGIFYSDDKGASWTRQGNGVTNEAGVDSYPDTSGFTCVFSSIAAKVSGGNTYIFAGSGDKRTGGTSTTKWGRQGTIYRSSNGGSSWTNVLSIGNYCINEIVFDPQNSNILYAATGYGIYKTTNALAATPTFSRVNTNSAISVDAVVVDGTTYVWALSYSSANVYRWNGSAWSTVARTGLPTSSGYRIKGKPGSSSIAYVGLGGSFTSSLCGVFRTTDSGANFSQITKWNTSTLTYGWRGETGQTTMYARTIDIDPTNTTRVYMGSSSQIYMTENSEAAASSVAWEYIYTKKELSNPNRWTHTGLCVMGAARSYTVSGYNQNVHLLGTGDHGLMISGDGGASWKVAFDQYHLPTGSAGGTGIDCAAVTCDPLNPNYIWACDGKVYSSGPGQAYLARSTDAGVTWTEKSALRARVDNILLDIDGGSGGTRRMWVSFGGEIYYSANGYTTEALIKDFSAWVERLVINPAAAGNAWRGYLYAAVNGNGVYYCTNPTSTSSTWTKIGTLSDANDVSITSDGLTLYACNDSRTSGGVWKATSTNGVNFGAWSKVWPTGSMVAGTDYYNLAIKAVLVSPSNDNTVYCCAEGDDFNYDQSCGSGLWKSTNGGTSWTKYGVNDGILVQRCFRLERSPSTPYRIYCSSNGAGVFQLSE